MGTFLFVVAVVGNAAGVAIGLMIGFVVSARRALLAFRERQSLALAHDSAFHHPDKIRTSVGELIFMGGALLVVLVGLPLVLGAMFHFLVPLLGRAWIR